MFFYKLFSTNPTQGLNIMGFCKEYNAATAARAGETVPVEVTVFEVSNAAVVAAKRQPR